MDSSTTHHVVISIDHQAKAEKSQVDQPTMTTTTQVPRDINENEADQGQEETKKMANNNNNVSQYIRVKTRMSKHDMKRLSHSAKVGIALVIVSLLYLLDPLYNQVGDNAMWAIMTVVVIFEFYAGATLGKGLNRGLGTILGGGLGCLAASFAQQVGGTGNSIIVGISVFVFGALATYSRLIPRIKKSYDYGVMIFILTFNLVIVSGLRAEKILQLARERLATIGMGFAVCIFVSLFLFPNWASDELHESLVSKFQDLASSVEGCMEEYFVLLSEKENRPAASKFSSCKSVLNSKAKDEQLANFAKWEPWHGKFGLYYPWKKYLQIGESLRELAASILSLKNCIQSPRQPSSSMRQSMKEPCEEVGGSLAWCLRELGNSIINMRRCQQGELIVFKLKAMRVELNSIVSASKLAAENVEALALASFIFLLMEIVEKVEEIAKQVEELGELVSFDANAPL